LLLLLLLLLLRWRRLQLRMRHGATHVAQQRPVTSGSVAEFQRDFERSDS
jgi:hypothetical protein